MKAWALYRGLATAGEAREAAKSANLFLPLEDWTCPCLREGPRAEKGAKELACKGDLNTLPSKEAPSQPIKDEATHVSNLRPGGPNTTSKSRRNSNKLADFKHTQKNLDGG